MLILPLKERLLLSGMAKRSLLKSKALSALKKYRI